MSRKHAHRADNQPVTRRYVRSVVQRARDEIVSAIVNGYQPWPRDEQIMHGVQPMPLRSTVMPRDGGFCGVVNPETLEVCQFPPGHLSLVHSGHVGLWPAPKRVADG
jgi:hypothetical protein